MNIADVFRYDERGTLRSTNLAIKSPMRVADLEHLLLAELTESFLEKERQIAALMDEIRDVLRGTR